VNRKFIFMFYIKCDITSDIIMFDRKLPPNSFRHWIRHTASVPKGFLRYYVLKMLKEKPMSGSEIMSEIERETGGRWKPSPGSVYPLLAWFQDNGYIKEVPKEESGIKRYTLTERGEKFFEEQAKLKEKLQRKLEFLTPAFWVDFHSEKMREFRESFRRLAKALFDFGFILRENLTEQTVREVKEILNHTAERIEEINKRLREGKQNG